MSSQIVRKPAASTQTTRTYAVRIGGPVGLGGTMILLDAVSVEKVEDDVLEEPMLRFRQLDKHGLFAGSVCVYGAVSAVQVDGPGGFVDVEVK